MEIASLQTSLPKWESVESIYYNNDHSNLYFGLFHISYKNCRQIRQKLDTFLENKELNIVCNNNWFSKSNIKKENNFQKNSTNFQH